jgi:hypothetical protein
MLYWNVIYQAIYIRAYVHVLGGIENDNKFDKVKLKESTLDKLKESLLTKETKLVYQSKCPRCRSTMQLERAAQASAKNDPQSAKLTYNVYSKKFKGNKFMGKSKLNYTIDLEEMVYDSVFTCDMNNVLRHGYHF